MNPLISRRSLLAASLAETLPLPNPRNRWITPAEQARDVVNIKDFGARGDGRSDDAAAFRAALKAASQQDGEIFVPASGHPYLLASTIALERGTSIRGASGQNPTLQLGSGADILFTFTGTAEAAPLDLTIANLVLESPTPATGIGLRVRNFTGVFLSHVAFQRFRIGLWTDWGIGVHCHNCSFIRNGVGLQAGGAGDPGGIRGRGREADPFMDTVVVDACTFSQNILDINDMGSVRSLGGLVVRDSTFFEAYAAPVAEKRVYVQMANRKGAVISGNWFECGQPSRTLLRLGNQAGGDPGWCRGAMIFGNHFLHTAKQNTVGVELSSCDGGVLLANCFEFAPGNAPIRVSPASRSTTVEPNSYLTYPDTPGYQDPVQGTGH